MEIYKVAHGDCTICNQDIDSVSVYYDSEEDKLLPGSPYWTPIPDNIWDQIVPHIPSPGYRTLFFPDLNKPFCSPYCVKEYYHGQASEGRQDPEAQQQSA